MVDFTLWWSRLSSVRMWTRSLASRLESGSSKSSTPAWRQRAAPTATRCRWPPESARGFRFRRSLRPRIEAASRTRRSISGFGHPAQLQREGHVPVHRHVRVERVALEHHGDVPVLRRQVGDRLAADADVTTGDVLEPGDHPEGGGLPAAGGSHQDHELPILDGEVHPGHGGHVAEPLLDRGEDDLGHQPATARSFFSASSIAARGDFPPFATSANMVGMMNLAYMLVAVLVIGPG